MRLHRVIAAFAVLVAPISSGHSQMPPLRITQAAEITGIKERPIFEVNFGEWYHSKVDWIKGGWTLQRDGDFFAFSAIHNDDGGWWYGHSWHYAISVDFYDGKYDAATKKCTGNKIYTATFLSGRIAYGEHLDNITESGNDKGASDRMQQLRCESTTRQLSYL